MNISYKWLSRYIDTDLTPDEVSVALTSLGLEVGALERVETIRGGLRGLVVGHVLTCIDHPNSDHLHITTVDLGDGNEPVQIVCGAPNVAAGQKVIVATLGTKLYDGDQEFTIKRSKMRGEESLGMICAEDEIGVGTSHDGIIVLPADTPVGMPAAQYYGIEDDWLIEVDLTPNRIDGASHFGVARDLSAWCKQNGRKGTLLRPDTAPFAIDRTDGGIPVEVLNAEACPRYSGLTVRGVKVQESPKWLRDLLLAVGQRPINNIVDITNYLLLGLGQPMHCFDLAKVRGDKVVVRTVEAGRKFVTLDGVERTLTDRDLMICNAEEPMCIGGVFGGLDSGVTEQTTDIFLESAYFHPTWIRKTARRFGLNTDASFRFERGADPECALYAAKRAALLILELAGGRIAGKVQEVYPAPIGRKQIDLDYDRIEGFIGKKIGHDTIGKILAGLNYEFLEKRENGALVAAPTYMVDVYRECDVVEEILRIYGYDNVEFPQNLRMSVNATPTPEPEAIRNGISNFLAANGFTETMNNSLTKEEYYTKLTTFPAERCVRIVNPLSQDLNVMRQTLVLNGLEVIAYNINRQVTSMKTFEYGSVYQRLPEKDGTTLEGYEEHQNFALFLTGTPAKSWRTPAAKSDFFQLKGYVDLILRRFRIDPTTLATAAAPADIYAEGIVYCLPGKEPQVLATLGTVNPVLAKRFGIKQPVFAAEIVWPVLFKLVKRDKFSFTELPKFPEVRRDLAILLDESVPYGDLRKSAFRSAKKLLKSVTLFDVYRGENIPAGKKQYALNFVLQDPERTLTDAEVEKAMERILGGFQSEFGAVLR